MQRWTTTMSNVISLFGQVDRDAVALNFFEALLPLPASIAPSQ